MSARKSERLLNLLITLLVSRGFVTKRRLREVIPDYADASSEEAFEKMFERDKEDLRALGVPIEVGGYDPLFEDEAGYRIVRSAFELPDLSLEADEAAVIGLAARVWQQAGLAAATTDALRKLKGAGVEVDRQALDLAQPQLAQDEPSFETFWQAVAERRPVLFPYRPATAAKPAERRLQPWGIVSYRSRWYVVGHDLDREAPRMFRLSRVAGEVRLDGPPGSFTVPEGTDLRALASRLAPDSPERTAALLVRPARAVALRHRATSTEEAVRPGWDRVQVAFGRTEALADEVASYGADVLAESPEELRAAVLTRLRDAGGLPVDQGSPRRQPSDRPRGDPVTGPASGPVSGPVSGGAGGPARPPAAGSRDQVSRLLALVPYLQHRGEISVEEVAREFGVSPRTVRRDIGVLLFCGLPGLGMGDLIDIDFDAYQAEGVIRISNADYLARPLRLDSTEAAALVVGLRALMEGSSGDQRAVVQRTLEKVEQAAGEAATAAASLDLRIPHDEEVASVRTRLEAALAGRRQVRLGHRSPVRDEVTDRVVEPIALLDWQGHTYLDAWCRRVEDRRLFRLDRVTQVEVLEDAVTDHAAVPPLDLSHGAFRPSPDALLATVRLGDGARWVAEYYPVESVTDDPDGGLTVRLRVADPTWLVRLMLRLGPAATLVEPSHLADRVREAARAALAAYDETASAGGAA